MSAPRLVLRIIVASLLAVIVGTIGVIGFTLIEPFYLAFGEPSSSLNWGTPGSTMITFASVGILGLLLVIVIWFVYAPIRQDKRQQFRR